MSANGDRTLLENSWVLNAIPFVEQLARRVVSTMPRSVDVHDLVQDGVLGLMDAAARFDESLGVKFETFAKRRVHGAMIDALRKDAWPRGVRRQRRELEAAREELRHELGHEPSLSELAAKVGSDEKRLSQTVGRINESIVPQALIPSEPEQPDIIYEREESKRRVRAAIATLSPREQKIIRLHYHGEISFEQIGPKLGVHRSLVSRQHARAIGRLREALEQRPSAQMFCKTSSFRLFLAPGCKATPVTHQPMLFSSYFWFRLQMA